VLCRQTRSIPLCADIVPSYGLRGCVRTFHTNSWEGNDQVMFVFGNRTAHVPYSIGERCRDLCRMIWVCLIMYGLQYHLTGRGSRGVCVESVAVEKSGVLGCYTQ
jgi:hypothetical protein